MRAWRLKSAEEAASHVAEMLAMPYNIAGEKKSEYISIIRIK